MIDYFEADPRVGLAAQPDHKFACAVTSVPYWGRRSYLAGDDREIGVGDLSKYVEDLRSVFDALRPKMRPDGLLWLNVGDTSAGSGGSGGDYYNAGGVYADRAKYRQGQPVLADGWRIPAGQWCDVPGHVVHALQRDGWMLRAKIVWNKTRPRREDQNHTHRPGENHELIYMLSQTKASGYRYFHDREVEKGDVWSFGPSTGKGKGKAPFPVELPHRCIIVSSEPGDDICDPFAGSGASGIAAGLLGRHATLYDLDVEAIQLAVARTTRENLPIRDHGA